MKMKIKKLKNGLLVIAVHRPSFESVGIAFGVRFGSIYENPDEESAAHFLEHMLFKGTKKRTWKDIEGKIRELGAEHNAATDYESTVFHMKLPKGNFTEAMELLSDLIINSTLPSEEMEKERSAIINEKFMREDIPEAAAFEEVLKQMFDGAPMGRAVIGSETSIKVMTREKLLAVYKKYYVPNNSVVVIYGGINEKIAFENAQTYFGELSGKIKKPYIKPAGLKQTQKRIELIRKNLKEAIIVTGLKLPPFSSQSSIKETATAAVVTRILSNRLFDRVRGLLGLSYAISAIEMIMDSFGALIILAGTVPADIKEVEDAIIDELKLIHMETEIDGDTKKAVSSLVAEGKLTYEDSLESTLRIGYSYLISGDYAFVDKYITALQNTTSADIHVFVKRLIDYNKTTTIVMKPELQK